MKKYLLICLAFVFTVCCKKSDNSNSNSTTILADGTINYGININGGLHVLNIKSENGSFPSITLHKAFVWMGSELNSQSAGVVTCNDSTLQQNASLFNMYFFFGQNLFNVDSNNIAWKVAGNAATGIAAFNYVDSQPWPKNFDFFYSATTVNPNNDFTITFPALPANVSGIIFSISGVDDDKSYGFMGNTKTSITFSSSDLKSVIKNGNLITISAQPVIISEATIAGKRYNFLKSYLVSKLFPVQ
ncbi:MAG: hypothetical protein ACOVO1_08260 [Chitinophagaceae bacterium]